MKLNGKIKAIIFDLGGVLINIDWKEAYDCLTRKTQVENINWDKFEPVLHSYERGQISSAEFRKSTCEILGVNLSDEEFDRCWNAMIFDFPEVRKHIIRALRKKYRVYLLSNINEIHRLYVEKQPYWEPEIFDEIFWSCQLGSRKPEPEIYKKVLDKTGVKPGEVIFFDDMEANVLAAQRLGIQAILVDLPIEKILEI